MIDLSKLPNQPRGIDLSKLPNQPKKKNKILGAVKNFGIGFGKSVGQLASGASALGELGLQAGTRAILPKSLESPSLSQKPIGTGLIDAGTFKADNFSQSAGKLVGDIASFAVPASRIGQIPKGASLAVRGTGAIKQGLLSGAMDLTQSGGQRTGALEFGVGAAAGLALPNFARQATGALQQAPQAFVREATQLAEKAPRAIQTIAKEVINPEFAAEQAGKRVAKRTLSFARTEAPKIGLPDSIINTIKNANPETKVKMQEIFKVSNQATTSKLAPRPIEVVGRQLVKEANTLQSSKNRIGGLLNKEKQALRGLAQDIDTSSVRNRFQRQLGQQGVKFNDIGEITSYGKGIMNKGDQKQIAKVYEFISKPRSVESVVDFNVGLFDELNLQKQALKISRADALTASVRKSLKKKVGVVSPELNNLQTQYAEVTQALGNFSKAIGASKYTDDSIKNIRASELARRLLNRNTGRQTQVIKDLLKANAKIEGKGELVSRKFASLQRQIELSDVLEDILNIAPSASFKKEVGKGITQAADVALDFVPYGSTIKSVSRMFGLGEKPLRKEQLKLIQDLITNTKI